MSIKNEISIKKETEEKNEISICNKKERLQVEHKSELST